MTRYLISFDAHAMDHIPDEDMPAVARASHEVVQEALNAGVWVFGGGLENQKASRGHRRDGHRRPVPRGHRRVLCRRRALTRGGAGVGCQERRRVPLRARSPGVHARPSRGELIGRRDAAKTDSEFGNDAWRTDCVRARVERNRFISAHGIEPGSSRH
jgi:hypothetical protein